MTNRCFETFSANLTASEFSSLKKQRAVYNEVSKCWVNTANSDLNMSGYDITNVGAIIGVDGQIFGMTGPTGPRGPAGGGGGGGSVGPLGSVQVSDGDGGLITNTGFFYKPQDPSNNVLQITGNIVPSQDVMYDLGSTGLYWRHLYVSNNSIKFVGSNNVVTASLSVDPSNNIVTTT